jgi:hypothetical protein
LATTGLSSEAIMSLNAATPLVVALPAWSTFTFTVTGTPCRGPSGSPRRTAASAASAAASAWSASTSTTAFSVGFTACTRARQDCTASRLRTAPPRIPAANAQALQRQRSGMSTPHRSIVRRPGPARGFIQP